MIFLLIRGLIYKISGAILYCCSTSTHLFVLYTTR